MSDYIFNLFDDTKTHFDLPAAPPHQRIASRWWVVFLWWAMLIGWHGQLFFCCGRYELFGFVFMFWHMIGGAGNSMFCIEEKGLNLLMLMTWSTCWIRFSLDKPHLWEANFFYGSLKQFVNWSRMLVYSESQLRRLINQVCWCGPPRTRILLHLRLEVLQRCKHSYSEFDLYNDVLDSIICHGGHNFR